MQYFKNHLITKYTSILLTFLLFTGNLTLGSQTNKEEKLSQAVKLYFQLQYEEAISYLEEIENLLLQNENALKAKIYLLYCACYEKIDKKNLSKAFFSKIEFMLEEGLINQFPEIEGVESELVKIYKQNIEKNEDESETTENKDQEADQYHFNQF